MINRRNVYVTLLLLISILVLVGCGNDSNNTSAPNVEPNTGNTNTTTEKPAVSENWPGETDWLQVVEAAKKEGKLVLSAPSGDIWRDALLAFEKEYPEIKIEYTPISGRDFWPKMNKERELGQYLWDLRVGGTDSSSYDGVANGSVTPIRPLFVLPEINDDSKWMGGLDAAFADKEKEHLFAFASNTQSVAYINHDSIPENELKSDEDLLDPKWRGKISLQDPRAGAGLNSLGVMYKVYGEEFVRKLLTEQDVVVTNDSRQQAEWLVRGNYPIAIGVASAQLVLFQQQGLGKNIKVVSEGVTSVVYGVGTVTYFDKAPHPNASKLFVNWLLTAKTQAEVARITELNSRRTDVPPGDENTLLDPKLLDQYIYGQHEDMVENRDAAKKLADELVK